MSKKLITSILSFLTIFLLFTNITKAESGACLPKDHASMEDMKIGYVVDNLVGIVTDQIFGPINNRSGIDISDVFKANNASWGDRDWDEGIVKKMFLSITMDIKFQVLFYLSVILLIAYMGISFAMGYSALSSSQLLKEFVKIGIIVFFITPTGWDFYLEFIVKNVLEASRYFNKAIISSMYNIPIESVSSPFQPINMILSVILNKITWSKILSLMFAGGFLFAILVAVITLYILVTCVIVLFKAVILYATTIIIASVLLSVGPIFAIFALFDQTRTYFNKWITNLFGVFMQQYILFLGFFLFCVIITAMLKGVFYFESCWGPAMSIKLKIKMPQFIKDIVNAILSIVKVLLFGKKIAVSLPEYIINVSWVIFSSYMPTQPIHSFPANIFSIAGIFIVTMMFAKFIDMISDLGSELANAQLTASSIARPAMKALTGLQQGADSIATEAAKDIVTGKPALATSRAALAGKDFLDKKIASREALGKTGFATTALKGVAAVLSTGTGLAKLIKNDDSMNKIRAMESNQYIAKQVTDKKLAEFIGNGTATQGSTVSDLSASNREEIDKAIKEELKKKGHSGIFKTDISYDQNGKKIKKVTEMPITEGMIEESLKAKIVKKMPDLEILGKTVTKGPVIAKLGANLDYEAKKENIVYNFVKNRFKATFVKTNLLNRFSNKNHW